MKDTDQGTPAYEKALRKRAVWVEPRFGEAKDWHGLRRFRLRRLPPQPGATAGAVRSGAARPGAWLARDPSATSAAYATLTRTGREADPSATGGRG